MERKIKQDLQVDRDIKRELAEIETIIKSDVKDNLKYDSIKAIFTELAEEIAQAKLSGMLEQLTGFWGPKVAEEFLVREIERAKRIKKPLTVAFLDIDFLKYINDTYGHITGTKAIKELSIIIKSKVRRYDVVSRYGGDEFLIIFTGANTKQADRVLERIKKDVSELLIDGKAKLTLSKGLAEYKGEDDINAEKLLDLADKELYKAKETRVNINLKG